MAEAQPVLNLREIPFFPLSPSDELQRICELGRQVDCSVIPIPGAGYVVHKNDSPYIAEAPLVLLDFDDTGAQTTSDKVHCWEEIQALGIPQEVVKECDKISRVYLGDEEPMYEPELEMRLLSRAKQLVDSHKSIDKILASVQKLRAELVATRNFDQQQVETAIRNIYDRTRYTSTLYPDTIESLRRLHGNDEIPTNVAILTYGDPVFQFTKTSQLLREGVVSTVFLTTTRKGRFFQEALHENPFQHFPLVYRYTETPRGIGVDFKNWQVMVVLFDDDPKQVTSFNSVAEHEGITGLGVVRVRRAGVKRAEKDTPMGALVTEIQPSDTYLDANLFEQATKELEIRVLENFLVSAIKQSGVDVLTDKDVARIFEIVTLDREMTSDTLRVYLLERTKT